MIVLPEAVRIFTAFLTVMLCAGLIPHAGASEAVGTMRVGLHYGNGVLNEASISNADGAGFTAGCYDGSFTIRIIHTALWQGGYNRG